ncbi:hypothetical protein [Sinobaca sp. H24]|uniref:hypothetical protein n=1 Tax=Sinobaca sp. H24 TaxID=2923376 RepID=UPI00207997BD|nr:hypothetical protein [Sinobaca sp. H24]
MRKIGITKIAINGKTHYKAEKMMLEWHSNSRWVVQVQYLNLTLKDFQKAQDGSVELTIYSDNDKFGTYKGRARPIPLHGDRKNKGLYNYKFQGTEPLTEVEEELSHNG